MPEKKTTEKELIEQTLTWLEKIKNIKMESITPRGKEMLTNIDAYIHDTQHFFDKNDYVRAFEAVIWAWAWWEIGLDLGHLKKAN